MAGTITASIFTSVVEAVMVEMSCNIGPFALPNIVRLAWTSEGLLLLILIVSWRASS